MISTRSVVGGCSFLNSDKIITKTDARPAALSEQTQNHVDVGTTDRAGTALCNYSSYTLLLQKHSCPYGTSATPERGPIRQQLLSAGGAGVTVTVRRWWLCISVSCCNLLIVIMGVDHGSWGS